MKLLNTTALIASLFLSVYNFLFYFNNKPTNLFEEVLSENTSFVVTENMLTISLVLAITSLIVFIVLALVTKMRRPKSQLFLTAIVIMLAIATITSQSVKKSFKLKDVHIGEQLFK